MKKYKNIKISLLAFSLLFSLFLPSDAILAQTALPISTDVTDITARQLIHPCNIETNKTCYVDEDGDGVTDIEITNKGLDPATGKPNLQTRSLRVKSVGGSQFIESPALANYIAATYRYAVAMITILTTIMIIMSGVIWTTSAGNQEKINKAKQMISRSLAGLVIALGSYTILYTINPDLVEFRSLQVIRVEKFTIETPIDYGKDLMESTSVAPSELENLANLAGIKNITIKQGVDSRLTPETRMNLASAMEQFIKYNSGGVMINDATRTPDQQYALLVKKCGCDPVEVLFPKLTKAKITKVTRKGGDGLGKWQDYCKDNLVTNCQVGSASLTLENGIFKTPQISHLGGRAIDMSAFRSGSYKPCGGPLTGILERDSKGVPKSPVTPGGDWCIPKEQQKLIRAMNDNNFCVGLNGTSLREPWHFELYELGKISGFCVHENDPTNPQNEYLKKLKFFIDPTAN